MSANRFQCNVCGYYYKNVDAHKKSKHPETRVECDLGQYRLGSVVEDSARENTHSHDISEPVQPFRGRRK